MDIEAGKSEYKGDNEIDNSSSEHEHLYINDNDIELGRVPRPRRKRVITNLFTEYKKDKLVRNSERTIEKWRERASQLVFIYDFVVDKYRRRINIFTLLAFLLGSMATLSALSNIGVSDKDYPTAALALKIVNTILTAMAAICAGVIKTLGWIPLVDLCQKYLDSVEHFVAAIISEQTLAPEFRSDPSQFILQYKDKFLTILGNAPNISQRDYLTALDRYKYSKVCFRQDLICSDLCSYKKGDNYNSKDDTKDDKYKSSTKLKKNKT